MSVCVATDFAQDKLDLAVALQSGFMDITHQALDVALQRGFLELDLEHRFTARILESVDKQTMRSMMHHMMVWLAEQKAMNPQFPVRSYKVPRWL